MDIILNGEKTTTTAATVAQLVNELTGEQPDGVAVALDSQVVPRSKWEDALEPGARVDILGAVQGG